MRSIAITVLPGCVPGEGVMVELKKGAFGGYRMSIDGFFSTVPLKRSK